MRILTALTTLIIVIGLLLTSCRTAENGNGALSTDDVSPSEPVTTQPQTPDTEPATSETATDTAPETKFPDQIYRPLPNVETKTIWYTPIAYTENFKFNSDVRDVETITYYMDIPTAWVTYSGDPNQLDSGIYLWIDSESNNLCLGLEHCTLFHVSKDFVLDKNVAKTEWYAIVSYFSNYDILEGTTDSGLHYICYEFMDDYHDFTDKLFIRLNDEYIMTIEFFFEASDYPNVRDAINSIRLEK